MLLLLGLGIYFLKLVFGVSRTGALILPLIFFLTLW